MNKKHPSAEGFYLHEGLSIWAPRHLAGIFLQRLWRWCRLGAGAPKCLSNILTLVFLSFITLPCIAEQSLSSSKPNVIFVAVDDMCDWVGPMGYSQAVTPNIDRLAQQGVTFTNAHCPGTFCAPSRAPVHRRHLLRPAHPEIV